MRRLKESTIGEIRQAMLNLAGSGVPEKTLLRMCADHAVGLLEHANDHDEWFESTTYETSQRIYALVLALKDAALRDLRTQAEKQSLDFHQLVAAHVLGIAYGDVPQVLRTATKVALFRFLYSLKREETSPPKTTKKREPG